MKTLQKISDSIVPLSRKQNIVLLIIIACVFQFIFFFAPALAEEAVGSDKNLINNENIAIESDLIIKTSEMGLEEAKLASPASGEKNNQSQMPAKDVKTIASSTPKVLRTSTHVITAYNSEVGQTDSDPCTTANGFNLCKHGQEDSIAANFLKFGTKVKIPELFGDKVFIVRDRMNKKHPNRIDVWMKEHSDAIKFGKKTATIQVIE